jgi:uncharacterized protein YjbI with pentapeptide repeats
MSDADYPDQIVIPREPGHCNQEHLARLRSGVESWNQWRDKNYYGVHVDLSGADLRGADLRDANLAETDLTGADLGQAVLSGASLYNAMLGNANLCEADLRGVSLSDAYLNGARLSGANLSGALINDAQLHGAHLDGANLAGADLTRANLTVANLTGANLSDAYLAEAKLHKANLTRADLTGSDLTHALLIGTQIEQARLSRCRIYGISAWDVSGIPDAQDSLIITPLGEAEVKTDNLKVAQFVYLILANEELRDVIDTIGKKAVLILGRFGGGGVEVLHAVAKSLRESGYLPMLFEFPRPEDKTYTDTVRTLAGLARFVIVDLSGPSVPQELYATVPHIKIPFVPIIEKGRRAYSMFVDLLEYEWVLRPILEFESTEDLLLQLPERVIATAETRVASRQAKLRELLGS